MMSTIYEQNSDLSVYMYTCFNSNGNRKTIYSKKCRLHFDKNENDLFIIESICFQLFLYYSEFDRFSRKVIHSSFSCSVFI